MKIEAVVECPVYDSFRVKQVAGMFDLQPAKKARETFAAEVPGPEEDWTIGLIVGPSGSGKTTIARKAFGEQIYAGGEWPDDRAVIDCFGEQGIKEITQTLTSVGFSSPPGWVKPYAVLSNGEKFRCDLARALMADSPIVVFDEFTSVVDRTVAKIGSAAVAKSIRAGRIKRRFVAVACHYDIADWLEPDWVLDMAGCSLARGRLRRPEIKLEIRRSDKSAWPLFERHHYMTASLHHSAKCFVGFVEGVPAAFVAVGHFPHAIRSFWKEHRTVVLPDFQGVGIGNAMSEYVASLFRATGKPYRDVTAHPGHVHHRAKSPLWRCARVGRVNRGGSNGVIGRHAKKTGVKDTHSTNRITMSFEYLGPANMKDARGFGVVKC